MLPVLHDSPPDAAPFRLISRRWRRQALASAEPLFYQVKVALKGILAHAWNLPTSHQVLASACAHLKLVEASSFGRDLHRMVVEAWCVHPDLIPCEKVIVIPELEVVLPCGPPMFINLEEVSFPN
jgi:hypothetical protein